MEIATKKSKRNISKLSDDFREKICDYGIEHNLKCSDALLVLKATGCRPSEIKKGIIVEFDRENKEVTFTIIGSKLNLQQKRGIRLRKVHVAVTNKNLKYLKPLIETSLKSENGKFKVTITSEKSFSGYITKISKKIWPRKQYHASAYSFRHAKATDLKNSTDDKLKIAKTMGHASVRSQQAYGRKRRNGKVGGYDDILQTEASSTPKGGDRLLRFKIANKNQTTQRLKAASKTSTTPTQPVSKMKR